MVKQRYFFYEKKFLYVVNLILFFFLVFTSCNSKNTKKPIQNEITELKAHTWYYFSKNGISTVDLPQNVPETAIKPWTEAIRITAAGNSAKDSCALVNRLGILDFSSGTPVLVRDVQLFSYVTADSLLFTPEGPAFHLYRNAYFNKEISATVQEKRTLIALYDSNQFICKPVLSYSDFGIPEGSEITSILPKNGSWLAVVKTATQEKTNFKYMSFSTPDEDGTIPNPEAAAITATEIDADTFRMAQLPQPFENAPVPLKNLFAEIPVPFDFYLSCRTEGEMAAVLYDNTMLQSPVGGYLWQGCGLICQKGAVAVFSDGTTYMNNSLLLNDSMAEGVTAFRLPKLPGGFVYGEFTVSGDKMYVAWEETDFYKTGRSGFICVDLNQLAKKD
ncbi:MAG: hypothetical protein J6B81_00725 [Spirochaetaceae bacterium]|nr:hypothetical protein [Spirochaetaceae bacterium]